MTLPVQRMYLLAIEWLGQNVNVKIVWGWLIAPVNCSAARVGTPAGYTSPSSIVSMLLMH